MKIGGFQKTTLVDYPGKVASIVFLSNCNMRCGYCYNADLACGRTASVSEAAVLQQLEDRRKYVDAVVITGGEPTIWPELPVFLKRLKQSGFSIKLDSNGLQPDRLSGILKDGLADYVAMDVKAPYKKYAEITGVLLDPDVIRQSIELIKYSGIDYEFRTTVAPGLTSEDLETIAQQITPARQWFLQPFQPNANVMDPKVLKQKWLTTDEIQTVCDKVKTGFGECKVRT